MAPLLSLRYSGSILQPSYRTLLPKIRVIRIFLKCVISTHLAVGSLGLGSIEVEQTIKACNLFITLYLSLTLSIPLLRDSLELMKIETMLDSPVFEENYSNYGHLVTRGWL